ncbi:MAG: tpl protein [Actinobacteria bacterium HGW-Actinobacteria-10]|jgi:cell fate regulator YaaT (PSP1 superfamily)|nr:MAG: tpl protein [Actinobacteria bacterium HGW-Actinobacteria-10]
MVIVDTERGTEMGEVFEASHEVPKSQVSSSLKSVVRIATDEDKAHAAELAEQERAALPVFRELINKHKLDMKPVAAEFLFDSDKVVFYFSAEERVDFRELVRDLASRFHHRIDMRQVGVRDEARIVGGIGHCGEQLCCDRFAGEFQPVSIRMAKEQDLPLNPLKISGLCGRLMCCLRYEFDAYKDYKSRAPKRGAMIETPLGEGKVIDLNTPKETVTVRIPEGGGTLTAPLSAMECGSGKGCPCVMRREALEEAGVVLPAIAVPPSEKPAEERKPRPERTERKRDESNKPRERASQGRKKGSQGQPQEAATEGTAVAGEATGDKPKSTGGRRRRRRRPAGGSSGTGSDKSGSTPT